MAFIGAFAAISALNTTLSAGRRLGMTGALPPEPPRKRFQHLRDWWPVYAVTAAVIVIPFILAVVLA